MVTVNDSVTKGLKDIGDIATDTVKETAAQMQENASACYERGRDKCARSNAPSTSSSGNSRSRPC